MLRDLVFEIGTEELPASSIPEALAQLERGFSERATAHRLSYATLRTAGTPRRLTLQVSGVANQTPDNRRHVQGPSVRVAFGPDGAPTQAATKFAASCGLEVAALTRATTAKGEYLTAEVTDRGQAALAVLGPLLGQLVRALNFRKSMRWGDVAVEFARPVQWILAMLGEEVIDVEFGDVRSGRRTFGHRFLGTGPITLAKAEDYASRLSAESVIVDAAQRKQKIAALLATAAQENGLRVLDDPDLLEQVANLVEYPAAIVGTFDERHLDLPREVLIQEMRSHQRYFSLIQADGRLAPKFVAITNTPVRDEALARRGFERVLRARLADGRFFFDEDKKVSLQDRAVKLERVVWQGQLGSYADKVTRIRSLSAFLAGEVGRSDLIADLDRVAALAKADLVSGMVGEFPELQGVMGREYATLEGESPRIALAIHEHYLPRHAADQLPSGDLGSIVGLADRLDTIVGIFAIGKAPTGAADPFGLRRATIACVSVILARSYDFDLRRAVKHALAGHLPKLRALTKRPADADVESQVMEFFRTRVAVQWGEGQRPDVVDAVLAANLTGVYEAFQRVQALAQAAQAADFEQLTATFKRVSNIVNKQGGGVAGASPVPALMSHPAETRLYNDVTARGAAAQQHAQRRAFAELLATLAPLKPSVDAFFDEVTVMADDEKVKNNRLQLLKQVMASFQLVADFSRLQAGEQRS